MPTAKQGDTVAIDFVVKTDAGQVVGNTEESGPQVVTLGKQEIFPAIEAALDGMEVGSVQQVKIESENAFGPRNEQLVIDVPRENLPPEPAPQPGMQLSAQGQDGQPIQLVITEVQENSVKADGNHPLAGEDLTFGVTLVEIKEAA